MSEEEEAQLTDTVSGEIGKITPWKSGKGYFLNLKGNENDFYGFGSCKKQVGAKVTLTVKEGTGQFSERYLIVKISDSAQEKPVQKEKPKVAQENVLDSVKDGLTVYVEKQELIVRQTCIKAAAEVVGHLVERSPKLPGKDIGDAVIDLADMFVAFCLGIDELPEENGEEPEPAAEGG